MHGCVLAGSHIMIVDYCCDSKLRFCCRLKSLLSHCSFKISKLVVKKLYKVMGSGVLEDSFSARSWFSKF